MIILLKTMEKVILIVKDERILQFPIHVSDRRDQVLQPF